MYSNSASDYITRKKNQNLQNIFNRKYASNNTMALQINTLRNTCALNDNGNDVPSTWFNVPMTSNYTNCNNAQIIVKNPTMPYMSRLPHMTIEPAWKIRYVHNFCGSQFPHQHQVVSNQCNSV